MAGLSGWEQNAIAGLLSHGIMTWEQFVRTPKRELTGTIRGFGEASYLYCMKIMKKELEPSEDKYKKRMRKAIEEAWHEGFIQGCMDVGGLLTGESSDKFRDDLFKKYNC